LRNALFMLSSFVDNSKVHQVVLSSLFHAGLLQKPIYENVLVCSILEHYRGLYNYLVPFYVSKWNALFLPMCCIPGVTSLCLHYSLFISKALDVLSTHVRTQDRGLSPPSRLFRFRVK